MQRPTVLAVGAVGGGGGGLAGRGCEAVVWTFLLDYRFSLLSPSL